MTKITITEFGTIGSSDPRLTPDEFRELEELALDDDRALMTESVMKGTRILKAGNLVGTAMLSSGTSIEILPKIADLIDEADVRDVFMRMLETAFSLRIKNSARSSLDSRRMNVPDIFADAFISKVNALFSRGIRGSYNRTEGNRTFVKGRIEFNENLKQNMFHKERFYLKYREFSHNRPENRLIRSALLKIRPHISDKNVRLRMRDILNRTENIPESPDIGLDLESCSDDRNMRDYSEVMMLCRLFLSDESLTMFTGTNRTSSFLMPMDYVFESYVAAKISEELRGKCRVLTQYSGRCLFDYGGRVKLRPDILIDYGKKRVIIDTKWKVVKDRSDVNNGDLYQVFAYSERFAADETILLYPRISGCRDVSFGTDNGIRASVRHIDLRKILDDDFKIISSDENAL